MANTRKNEKTKYNLTMAAAFTSAVAGGLYLFGGYDVPALFCGLTTMALTLWATPPKSSKVGKSNNNGSTGGISPDVDKLLKDLNID